MMKLSRVSVMIACLCISACSNPFDQTTKSAGDTAKATANTNDAQCAARANERLSLFSRADTFAITETDKRNAYNALFSECMKQYQVGSASPKPGFETARAGVDMQNLAALSPASGGNAAQQGTTRVLPNGVVVIDTAQYNNLSPAAGGNFAGITSSAGPNGSTVVVVQASPSTAIAYPPAPAAPTRPAAIAVDANGNPVPVQQAAPVAPKPLMEQEKETKAEQAPAKPRVAKPKKTVAKAEPAVKDGRTRFERNAVPIAIDMGGKNADLNGLQPSAGKALDSVMSTNKLPAKD